MQAVKDITIVSLSRGILGEAFVRHELEIGVKRLAGFGVEVHFSKHALAGLDFTEKHPELRARSCPLRPMSMWGTLCPGVSFRWA